MGNFPLARATYQDEQIALHNLSHDSFISLNPYSDPKDPRVELWRRFKDKQNFMRRINRNTEFLEPDEHHTNRDRDPVEYYESIKDDRHVIPQLQQLIENVSPHVLLGLADHLSAEHLALLYDEINKRLVDDRAWRELESKVVSMHEDQKIFDKLSPPARKNINKAYQEVTNREYRVRTISAVLSDNMKQKLPVRIFGNYGNEILKYAQEVRTQERYRVHLEQVCRGATKQLFERAAEIAYKKISGAMHKFDPNSQNDENNFIRFAENIGYHTQTPEFEKLLAKNGNHDFILMNGKLVECITNQKLFSHFGMQKKQLEDIARAFNMESQSVMTIYQDPQQNKVHRTGLQLMTMITGNNNAAEITPLLADYIQIALNLNAENKTEQAQQLLQTLQNTGHFMMGMGTEVWNQCTETAKTALVTAMLTPVIVRVAPRVAPHLAAFTVGFTLYHLYKSPEIIMNQLNEITDAIKEGKSYEAGQIAVRLGLHGVANTLLAVNIKNTLMGAFKNSVLDPTIKLIKKTVKTQARVNSPEFQEAYKAALPEIDKLNQKHGLDTVQQAQKILGAKAVKKTSYASDIDALCTKLEKIKNNKLLTPDQYEGAIKELAFADRVNIYQGDTIKTFYADVIEAKKTHVFSPYHKSDGIMNSGLR